MRHLLLQTPKMDLLSTPEYRAGKVYKRLLAYAVPHWRVFLLAVLGMVLFAGTDVTVARLMKPLVDGTFVEQDPQVIRWLPLAILGLFLVRGVAGYLSTVGMAVVGQRVVTRLRREVFDHIVHVPVTHHDRSTNADMQTRLTFQANALSDAAMGVTTAIVKDGLTAVGLLGLLFYTSWKLTLYVLVMAPLLAVSVAWVNKRFRRLQQSLQSSVGGIGHAADEAITGRRIVKIYGGEGFALKHFDGINEQFRKFSVKLAGNTALSYSVLEFIAAIGISSLVFMATRPETLKDMSAGTFTSFVVAMLSLRGPISNISNISERLQRGLVAGADIFHFLDQPRERDTGTHAVERAEGALRFDNVQFRYSDEASPALAGVTLDIPAGKTVAFVGKSGSGKSTLLSLIPRFYDPSAGHLLLDGHDLRDYPLKNLRQQLALVDQNIVLFNATVGENISYGQVGVTREQIEAAARGANAWEFIEKLPQGLDTPIGQAGVMLSGGQRQRITIARALLKNAPILILDEATSALDSESERLIQTALEALKLGRTTLVIAHRLSTIQNADLIVVMHDGRVAEQGTHAELLARNGAYAALHRLQFRESDDVPATTAETPLA
ncbi:MAG: lipid A export permease/ATP-binding protein MsbA [Pseudomonadota bacterium]